MFMEWHLIGWVLGLIFVLLAHRKKLLSTDGALAALVLAILLMSLWTWYAAIPVLFFFFSSSLLGKMNRKNDQREIQEHKGRERDLVQVFANGGIAAITMVLARSELMTLEDGYLIFLCVVATSTADTWATEIGTMRKSGTYYIIGFKKAVVGISGGVSIVGSMASLAAALSIGLLATFIGAIPYSQIGIIGLFGFLGSTIDSILGQLLQFKWKRNDHWREDPLLENEATEMQGTQWVTNDAVNLLSGLAVLILSSLYFLFLAE